MNLWIKIRSPSKRAVAELPIHSLWHNLACRWQSALGRNFGIQSLHGLGLLKARGKGFLDFDPTSRNELWKCVLNTDDGITGLFQDKTACNWISKGSQTQQVI